jgi:hypothetical protein
MSMSKVLDAYAPYNTVHCDWCQNYTHCRSLFNGDVWVMSICKECE